MRRSGLTKIKTISRQAVKHGSKQLVTQAATQAIKQKPKVVKANPANISDTGETGASAPRTAASASS
jgi:hypothetical protein